MYVNLKNKKIGFAITGSFYTFKRTIEEVKKLVKLKADVIPIMSNNAYTLDTRYGKAKDFIEEIEHITQLKRNKPIVIAISSDDALSAGGENIGKLLNIKNREGPPLYFSLVYYI